MQAGRPAHHKAVSGASLTNAPALGISWVSVALDFLPGRFRLKYQIVARTTSGRHMQPQPRQAAGKYQQKC